MSFEVRPIPETYLDIKTAGPSDRLVVVFENGQRMAFMLDPHNVYGDLLCDPSHSSPPLLEQLYYLAMEAAKKRPRRLRRMPDVSDLRGKINFSLFSSLYLGEYRRPPRVGYPINVNGMYHGSPFYSLPVAGGLPVKSVSSVTF